MTLFNQAPPKGQIPSTPEEIDAVLYKATPKGQVPFTPVEVAEWEAERVIILSERKRLQATQYQRDRAAEYPPMTDYIDGIVKNNQAQIQTYIDTCLAVKAKYPKPDKP